MIDSGSCDAVLVATPLSASGIRHLCIGAWTACDQRKTGRSLHETGTEMNEAAERSDRSFAIMLNQRTNCVYRKLHEMIQSGELGQLRRVNGSSPTGIVIRAIMMRRAGRQPGTGEGGGVLLNQCPHHLDLCCNGCAACL